MPRRCGAANIRRGDDNGAVLLLDAHDAVQCVVGLLRLFFVAGKIQDFCFVRKPATRRSASEFPPAACRRCGDMRDRRAARRPAPKPTAIARRERTRRIAGSAPVPAACRRVRTGPRRLLGPAPLAATLVRTLSFRRFHDPDRFVVLEPLGSAPPPAPDPAPSRLTVSA